MRNELEENAEQKKEKRIREKCKDKLTFQSFEPPILFVLCLVEHERRAFPWTIASVVPNGHASKSLHAVSHQNQNRNNMKAHN